LSAVDGDLELLLRGEKVGLGPLRKDFLALYARWVNDVEVKRGTGNAGIQTLEAEEAWYGEASANAGGQEPTAAHFTVHELANGQPIGTTGLFGMKMRHRSAIFGILIGEGRGQGYGTEATRLTLDWGFHVLALRNVMLEVLPWNTAAIRAYEKAGFKRIGARRNAALHFGERCDEILMDAIPEEFESPVLRACRDAT
jgi:diamine N-acetyltransferase